MPAIEIQSAPESQRIRPHFGARLTIRKAFNRIVGPAISAGQHIQADFSARSGTDIIHIQYFTSSPMPAQARRLIRDAALVADIADFEWSDAPMMVMIRYREQTAHELIEQIGEIKEARRKSVMAFRPLRSLDRASTLQD